MILSLNVLTRCVWNLLIHTCLQRVLNEGMWYVCSGSVHVSTWSTAGETEEEAMVYGGGTFGEIEVMRADALVRMCVFAWVWVCVCVGVGVCLRGCGCVFAWVWVCVCVGVGVCVLDCYVYMRLCWCIQVLMVDIPGALRT
jgi:hypothetical protein